MFSNMLEVVEANKRAGYHFFDADAMRFFNSRVGSALYAGRYFITSERFSADTPRMYTIREADDEGCINNASAYQQFNSRSAALAAVRRLIGARGLDGED